MRYLIVFAILMMVTAAQGQVFTSKAKDGELQVTSWERLVYCQEVENRTISINESETHFWVVIDSKESVFLDKSLLRQSANQEDQIQMVTNNGSTLGLRRQGSYVKGIAFKTGDISITWGVSII
jgi:hypothetical protein